jgi:hypothetical protein
MRLKAGSRAEGFKSHRGRSEKKLEKPLDKLPIICYNNKCQGRLEKDKSAVQFAQGLKSEKSFQRNLKIPLTNPQTSAIM